MSEIENSVMVAIPRAPIEHELKCWESYFHGIVDGTKSFELRRNDREFMRGDILWLRETRYIDGGYTGREVRRRITYILAHEEDLGLMGEFAILSLEPIAAADEIASLRAQLAEAVGLLKPWVGDFPFTSTVNTDHCRRAREFIERAGK